MPAADRDRTRTACAAPWEGVELRSTPAAASSRSASSGRRRAPRRRSGRPPGRISSRLRPDLDRAGACGRATRLSSLRSKALRRNRPRESSGANSPNRPITVGAMSTLTGFAAGPSPVTVRGTHQLAAAGDREEVVGGLRGAVVAGQRVARRRRLAEADPGLRDREQVAAERGPSECHSGCALSTVCALAAVERVGLAIEDLGDAGLREGDRAHPRQQLEPSRARAVGEVDEVDRAPLLRATNSLSGTPASVSASVRLTLEEVVSIEWSETRISTVRFHSPRARSVSTRRSTSSSASPIAAS